MNPFFTDIILPFLLVFVVIFAVLRKSQVLGDNKFADTIVAVVVAFIFVGVPAAVGFTMKLLPIITVLVVIILCYYLIFGFLGIHKSSGIMIALGIIFGIAFIGTILWATGVWAKISVNEGLIGSIIMLVVLGGAIAVVVAVGGSKKD